MVDAIYYHIPIHNLLVSCYALCFIKTIYFSYSSTNCYSLQHSPILNTLVFIYFNCIVPPNTNCSSFQSFTNSLYKLINYITHFVFCRSTDVTSPHPSIDWGDLLTKTEGTMIKGLATKICEFVALMIWCGAWVSRSIWYTVHLLNFTMITHKVKARIAQLVSEYTLPTAGRVLRGVAYNYM